MTRKSTPWSDELKQFITDHIEQRDGVLYWLRNRVRASKGDAVKVTVSKTIQGTPYLIFGFMFDGKLKVMKVHHIVFFLSKGYQCLNIVDHKDRDTLNNHPDNLREATPSQNSCNAFAPKYGGKHSVPFRGVMRSGSKARRYSSSIFCEGTRYSLGSYPTPEEAAKAYDKAAIKLHGEFAMLNFPNQVNTHTNEN